MNITPDQIKSQYDRVKRDGWLPWFEETAKKADTTVAHILAIGSRETNLENIKGDFRAGKYHGFGVMQIDIGTDPQYAAEWTPKAVEPSIRRGGEIYESKFDQVINGQGKSLTVKGNKFVGRKVEIDDARRIATAAYNSGLWAYYHFSNHTHVDLSTTGQDYSRDVYDRALAFAELLEADGEADAYAKEIRAQGKYATEEEKSKIKPSSVTDPVTDPVIDQKQPDPSPAQPEAPIEPKKSPTSEVELEGLSKQGASVGTKIAAGTAAVSPVITALGLKIGSVELSQTAIVAICGVIAVGIIVGAWLYNEGQKRGHYRQNLLIQKAASQTENTVRMV